MRKPFWKITAALGGGVVILAGLFCWLTFRTYHFAAVQPGVLYRCGNRGMAEFSNAVGRVHPKVVVSLVDDAEWNDPAKPQFRNEARYLANHHIRQERIPVQLGGWPSGADISHFLAIVAEPTNQPVLVHCAQGVRRTGMFVAAYQMSVMGWDAQRADDAVVSFGHGPAVVGDVREFIRNYDPHSQTVATTMPAGVGE